ncbi:unnamed protein product [Knipowitschia caucasica]
MKKTHGDIYKQQLQMTETQFSCYKCDKVFNSSEELTEHSASHNFNEKSFECPYCPATFYTYTEMTKHRRWYCGKRQCPCRDCGIKFPNPSRLTQHRVRFHSPGVTSQIEEDLTYKCSKCDCIFQNQEELIDHQEKDQDCTLYEPDPPKKRGRKPKSEKGFYDSYIKKDVNLIGEKKSKLEIPCPDPDCDLVFPSVDALRAHKKEQHGRSSQTPHACTECDQSFGESHQLADHIAKAHGPEEFTCPTCGERFPSTSDLTDHLRTHCKKEEPEFNIEII